MQRRQVIKQLITAAALPWLARAVRVPSASAASTASTAQNLSGRCRPGEARWPTAKDWQELNQATSGRLLRPESPFSNCGSAETSAACREALSNLKNPFYFGDLSALTQTSGWVGAWTSQPSVYAVAAESAADIVAAVKFARTHSLRLVVKGGGHSYQGSSCAADSLLIWTRHMNAVVLHDDFLASGCPAGSPPQPAVSVDAGAMWIDAYSAVTTGAGRYVQGGGCTSVGVPGLIQGGGFGSFSKKFGTAAAGLLEAEIVTADGEVRLANAWQNADLFWALKGGGGGTFGVITRVTLRTRELPDTFGAAFGTIHASSDGAYRALISQALKFYASALLNPHWGEQMTFRTDNTLRISMVFQGLTQQEAAMVWAPLKEWVQTNPELEFTQELKVVGMPARYFWDAAFFKKNAPGMIATDDRPGAPQHHFAWAGERGWIHAAHGEADSLMVRCTSPGYTARAFEISPEGASMADAPPFYFPRSLAILALAASTALADPAPPALSPAATQWWADISALADDGMEGRLTGSPGYLRAAQYVISRFKAEGLQPAGTQGYLQPVAFEQQLIDQSASTLELVSADGRVIPLNVGRDSRVAAGGAPAPDNIDVPLVFLGYGLHLPAQGEDDFAGMDLKGKMVVVLSGGPADIPGAIKSTARFERSQLLGKLGALGIIALTTPHQIEIPWSRQLLLAGQPGMYLADRALRETPDGFLAIAIDPAKAESLFAGTDHTFAELCALADASKPLPTFALPYRLRGTFSVKRESLSSPNVIAKLPGHDKRLAGQYVVVSAHLDHLGIGAPINGDKIYNGAMDDASGVATVLDIAHRLKKGPKPRRSILFVIVTAEEKGLLGSHYFAGHPTVPRGSIVADLNFDMSLPLWPLKKVFAPGEDESTLGADARAVATAQGLEMAPDPLPDRNVFIRTDQFSFVREGIPALAFKFGFAKDTPEFQIEHDWRANRYHAPSDDLDQPVMKEEAVKLDAFVAALTLRVADEDARPAWLPNSAFKPRAAPPDADRPEAAP